jgi:HlyD family secretion protein
MSTAPAPQPIPPIPQQAAPASPVLGSRTRARLRFWATFLFLALVVGGASTAVYRYREAQPAAVLPSAPARLGDFLVIIRCRGELKAERSVQIYTPMVPNLRISWMTPPGTTVSAGDPIVRFDSSSAQQTLMQKEAALRQAQATLDQALAQSKITAEQDKTDLADAGYTTERARLEASKQEIVSRLQGEESKIDYGVAQQKEKVQEATVDLHAASDRSRLASLTRQRDQAQSDVDVTKQRIAQMELKSPLAGFLIFQSNYSQGWMNAKPFKVGDNVYAGMVLAEMPDLTTMLMDAKVEEIDRGRISADQEVRVRIDSLPELTLNAKIRQISLLAEASNEFPPVRSFRAYAAIPKPDERLRPGMNGGMDIIINRIPKAISIPAKALFTHAGKPIVYVAEKGRYRAVNIEVLARNPDEIAVKGIPDGAMVTLVDPEKKDQKK